MVGNLRHKACITGCKNNETPSNNDADDANDYKRYTVMINNDDICFNKQSPMVHPSLSSPQHKHQQSISTPSKMLPQQQETRLITYADVVKYIVGSQASKFIIFAMVIGHLMFASGLLHLAIENVCYVVGWERLGWSYHTQEEYMLRVTKAIAIDEC